MRYNIFNRAHLPLKTALLSGCISLSKIASDKSDGIKEILEIVEKVLNTYNEQISYEALHVLPLIFEYEPAISSNYTTEHNLIAMAARSLSESLQSYQAQQKNHAHLLKDIVKRYNDFVLLNYNHMDDEEPVLNEILWRYYGDNVLKQTEEKMDILPHLVNKYPEKRGLHFATAA